MKIIQTENNNYWEIPDNLDVETFDLSWRPDPYDPPFIHQFGTQWQKTGGPRYLVEGATQVKYHDSQRAVSVANSNNRCWRGNTNIEFDYSWHPDDTEPPFIYQFGTQWQKTGGPRYVVKGATQVKYIEYPKATAIPCKDNWEIPASIDESKFDFSWHPDDTEPSLIYQFGTQWHDYDGPRYVVRDAIHTKFIDIQRAILLENKSNWEIPADIDESSFDFSWTPDKNDPPLIYQFGTQWQKTDGPRYVVPGATEIKYVDVIKCTRLSDKTNWVIPQGIDESNFDFSWHPDATEPPLIYQFGTQWQKTDGPRYVVPGATEIKYVDVIKCTRLSDKTNWVIPDNLDTSKFDFSWHPDATEPSFIYEFGTQWQKTGGPRYVVPGATETKYVDCQQAHINANPNAAEWQGNKSLAFDYSWHPDATEPPMIYQFGTQWQPLDGPKYVVAGAKVVKLMSEPVATAVINFDNWEIDAEHLDVENFDFGWTPPLSDDRPFIYEFGTQWQKTDGPRYVVPGATETKYVDVQIAIRREVRSNWEIPDNLDVTGFDFSWHPDATEPPFIYEFGTQWQKTGGPRYVVPGATKTKYVESMKCKKLPSKDNWEFLYEIDESSFDFSWHPDATEPPFKYAFGNQYRTAEETPTVLYVVPGATEIKYLSFQRATIINKPLDIIFVSNGEFGEQSRYDELCRVANRNVKWVRGVRGRENALKQAAELSDTEWFFLFPGKLRVNSNFDFDWQPNKYHDPKHYIFYAVNPVNGLQYGHMAAVAYNKQLVLDTENYGLDFTMSKLHDVVNINSGIAEYNSDPLMTWRTAFREAIKLQVNIERGDIISKQRLKIWLNIGSGAYAEYSKLGAKHGLAYYTEVKGDEEKLQLSFSWDWLKERFEITFAENKQLTTV